MQGKKHCVVWNPTFWISWLKSIFVNLLLASPLWSAGLQRGGGPAASGRQSRQRALGWVDAAGHPAVLHRLQAAGPAQHEVETAAGTFKKPLSRCFTLGSRFPACLILPLWWHPKFPTARPLVTFSSLLARGHRSDPTKGPIFIFF